MIWLRAHIAIIGLALSLLGSAVVGRDYVRDLAAQVTLQGDDIATQQKEIEGLKALPGAVDSLAFAARLQSLFFTCVQIHQLPEARCRAFYFEALQTGAFPSWSQVGPPDST